MSVYNPLIPLATDRLSTSQGQLKTNFTQLDTQFGVDHSNFNTGSGNGTGFHKQVTLPAPIAATASGTIGIIHSVNGTGLTFNGIPLPFFANFNNSATHDYPMLPDLVNTSGSNYTFTLGNLIFKLGTGQFPNSTGSQSATVTYGTAFPTAGLIVLCQSAGVSGINSPIFVSQGSITSSFTANRTNASTSQNNFYYLAIGY